MSSYILPFEKMHGLGNDFVMVHYKHLPENIDTSYLAKELCNRRFGIGADGLIIALPGTGEGDFAWEYINSDGSLGEMCGNGIRCFARYLFDRGIAKTNQFSVETRAGIVIPTIDSDGMVSVNMGHPTLTATDIPTTIPHQDPITTCAINLDNIAYTFYLVSMGNPHAITFANSLEEFHSISISQIGPMVENHPYFPNKTNVEVIYIEGTTIHFKVWERGSGETLACGTGACAAVVAACIIDMVKRDEEITVKLPGGDLYINWDTASNNVFMKGPADSVFLGQIELKL